MLLRQTVRRLVKAHPRGCGEHLEDLVFYVTEMGSSPRVRGTSNGLIKAVHRIGLIPAGAGNI